MVSKSQQNQGTQLTGFKRSQIQTIDMVRPATSLDRGQNLDTYFEWLEEFVKTEASQTAPWNTDYSGTGAPTYDYVTDGIGGQVEITLASDNAAMLIGSAWNDNLQIDAKKNFVAEARFFLPANLTTDEYILSGVCGKYQTTINPVTLAGLKCVVLYAEDNMNLRCLIMGGDDADIDFDTGIDLEDDTWYWSLVENDPMGYLNLYFGMGLGEDGGNVLAAFGKVPNSFAAGTKFQPVSSIGKKTGTTVPVLINDSLKGYGHRTNV